MVQESQLIKNHYRRLIREIMVEHGIQSPERRPRHDISANATFTEVVRYTDSYIAGSGDTQEHYRYGRYEEALSLMGTGGRREAHIDIGCGPGLFSWVFLDWARNHGIELGRVDLYGLDHSLAMIRLALTIKEKLVRAIPDTPDFHYSTRVDDLLERITENHVVGTDYTITFGHVLVQAHAPAQIHDFGRIISHVVDLINTSTETACVLAVDSRRNHDTLAQAWGSLLDRLVQNGIGHQLLDVNTRTNNPGDAKLAQVFPLE